MHPRPVLHLVSFLLIVLGLAMALCTGVGWLLGDTAEVIRNMELSAAITLAFGVILWAITRNDIELSTRDGIGVVTFGWFSACLVGTLPYLLTGSTPGFTDALFEVVSGLTTTGASIIPDPALLPRSVIFWRALTHFFGGMGILVLCVAILPLLGSGGMQIYRAETSGVAQDRLKPRIASTAKVMWGIYLLLNALLILLLKYGGMSWFDAICHAFAAVATGGFSTQSASIAAYNSLFIEICLIVFMLLSASNFALHYRALQGRWRYFRDAEFRFYFLFWLVSCLALTGIAWRSMHPDDLGLSARAAFFTGTSLLTTTGFCTEDFDLWPAAAKIILVTCMLVGGCAGSTCGAIKQIRLMVVLKRIGREIWQFIHPQAVLPLKVGRRYVEPQVANHISTYFGLYLMIFALGSLGLSFFTDGETAITSVAATLGGVGPGFSKAGATESYALFAIPAKGILIVCMLMGRLEFYALFAVLSPRFWRR